MSNDNPEPGARPEPPKRADSDEDTSDSPRGEESTGVAPGEAPRAASRVGSGTAQGARGTDSKRTIPTRRGSRRLARAMFYGHLWLGVAATGILLVVSITGILLNHKRGLGLMPDVPNTPTGAFADALPLAELANAASLAVPADIAGAGVDRMDVRPSDGLIKVRFDDHRVMEVTLDINSGAVLHVGERNDVFLEKLHSGEIFGDLWVLLSDTGAVLLLVLLVSGYWLWLYPKSRI